MARLVQNHLVVRYDRLGAGLSARRLDGAPTVERETSVLEAVLDACGDAPATVFASSCAAIVTASLAARSSERVDKLVFFGSYVSRDDLPDATRRSIVDFVRANWALAAQMLAGLIVRTRAATRSLPSAATSATPPMPTRPPHSSSSSCTATRARSSLA